ncbi:MAG: hypothetical protein GX567_19390 [Clostridia bacterium]|nr:hypothetical protein [Clostridia bacterium]
MPEVSAEDLALLDSAPAVGVPSVMAAEDLDLFEPVAMEEQDAPPSFWKKRADDLGMVFTGWVPELASNSLLFFGNAYLKDPSPKAQTLGKEYLQMSAEWDERAKRAQEFYMKGREGESKYDPARLLTQGAGSILMSLGVAMMMGAAAPALAITGGSFFEGFAAARKKGKNFEEASVIGGLLGISQGVPEFIGLHTMITVAGTPIRRAVLSAVTEGIQESTQQAGQEGVEAAFNLTDTPGADRLANILVAGAVGAALGGPASVGPTLAMRAQAKQFFVDNGFDQKKAGELSNKALQAGMNEALKAARTELELHDAGITRSENGDYILMEEAGKPTGEARVLTQEEVVARFVEKPKTVQLPAMEKVQEIVSQAAPQRETVGVTEQEKAFVEPGGPQDFKTAGEQAPVIDPKMLQALNTKLQKIDQQLKSPTAITKKRVQAIQKSLLDFVKSKALTPQDQKKFTASILNTQTMQQLERILPEIKERINALQEKQNQREQISRFQELTNEKVLAKIDDSYATAIRNLVKDLSPTKLSVKTAMRLEKLADIIVRDPDNTIPLEEVRKIEKLDLKSLRDMKSEDIEAMNDVLGQIIKAAETKATLLYGRKLKDRDAFMREVMARISKAPLSETLLAEEIDPSKLSRGEGVLGKVKNIVTLARRHIDIIAQELDGSDGGPIKQVVWAGFNDARVFTLRLEQAVQDYFMGNLKGMPLAKWSEYIAQKRSGVETTAYTFVGPEGDKKIHITPAQRLYFYLAMQNEKQARHILNGGLSFDKKDLRGTAFKVPAETVISIIESVENDPQLARAAEVISEYLNGFQKDLLNTASLRHLGKRVATEDNYVHIRANENLRSRMKEILAKQSIHHALLEGMGMLKERVLSDAPIYLDDIFASVQEGSSRAIRYATYIAPLRAAKALVNNNEFRAKLISQGRENYLKALEGHIQRVEGELIAMTDLDLVFQTANQGVIKSILRLNPRIALMQYTAHFSSLAELDPKHWGASFRPTISKETAQEIKEWSPVLYDRFEGHITREIGELVDVSAVRKTFTGESTYHDWMLSGIRKADRAVIGSIWRAVKAEVQDKQPELKGDAFYRRVAERAEEVVRKTQAPFDVNDRSAMLASKGFWERAVTVFGSEIDALSNMVDRANLELKQSAKSWDDVSKYVKRLAVVYVLNGLMSAFIRLPFDMLKELPDEGREDEQVKDAEAYLQKFLVNILSGPFGLVFGVRELADIAISGLIRGGSVRSWSIRHPVANALEDAGQAFAKITSGLHDLIMEEEYSRTPKKAKKDWLNKVGSGIMDTAVVGAAFTGMPVGNVVRFIGPLLQEPEPRRSR